MRSPLGLLQGIAVALSLALSACEGDPASAAADASGQDSFSDLAAADGAADTPDAAETVGDIAVLDATSDTTDAQPSDAAADTGPDTAADGDADGCQFDYSDSSPAVAPWSTLKISKGAGPCPPEMICSWTWTLAYDGTLAKSMAGVASQAKMDAAELSTLSTFLGNPMFEVQMNNGFTCPPPPTDVGVSFEFEQAGKKAKQDVTGCIYGPACNDAKLIYAMVTKY